MWCRRFLIPFGVAFLATFLAGALAFATGVPIAGFQAYVGLGLTDEFQDDDIPLFFQSQLEPSLTGTQFGAGGTPYYDLALLDTGAAVSLITTAADAAFDIDGAGFRGTETLTLGGATGFLQATINDPMAMFVTGTANVTGTTPLTVDTSTLVGQSSVSLLTIPPESDLPNVVGIPFLSQYATYIRSDQPQIFQQAGQTVRSPQVDFLPLGAGGQGITRRAPMQLKSGTGVAFTTAPVYVYNFENITNGEPWTDNPTTPTILQEPGALFLNVDVQNEGESLNNFEFFFDTGADVTVVSELNAVRLGFDPILDEPDFTIAVTGSGGVNLEVPGFYVEEFTIQAVGGTITATNVPVIVLDIADPTNPANIVDGIVGTNLLAGRNVVIDPQPSLGGGGVGPSLYISDPITSDFNWSTANANGQWTAGGNWSAAATPDNLGIANVRHVAGGNQTAILSEDTIVWELNVSGTPSQTMTVQINSGQTLTTFAGVNIETGGAIQLVDSIVDTQNIEILAGGMLSGAGQVRTGSGPLPGQVENRDGTVAPGNGVGTLEIEGRFSNSSGGTLAIEIGGLVAGTTFDLLAVEGPATLSGILDVSLVDLGNGIFDPQVGDLFEILTATDGIVGAFDTLLLPVGYEWLVRYNANSVELGVTVPGDFDADFDADADDLTLWQSGFGGAGGYTGNDFLAWQRGFGSSASSPAVANNVPEPSTFAICLIGFAMGPLRRTRSKRQHTDS